MEKEDWKLKSAFPGGSRGGITHVQRTVTVCIRRNPIIGEESATILIDIQKNFAGRSLIEKTSHMKKETEISYKGSAD